ncbi:LPP20 family lipoprotein [Oceanicoccus sagamiensis]|uniref:Uncharacterized protein n=1 Tax=Oceanicoccus sagamiensis TaxID=716816 RepID=A0A1X9NED0_9GAMM|nr:LPP20 family lipoprotein [Oceanicoccus sagamiensis]ARN74245.1 hypothetical protein BST96_09010 [Oceanicoccus sagamiensis]
MKRFVPSLILSVFFLGLGACSSNTTIESDLGIDGAPAWVNEGTQAVDNDDGQLLHGVGMAPPMGDTSLQKSAADNRARAEIARILQTYVDSTLNDYTASVGDSAELNIEREIRTATKLAISGSRILGHWKHEETGDIYAFAELSIEAMDELIAKADNLSSAFKQYYDDNNKANFDRFVETTTQQ